MKGKGNEDRLFAIRHLLERDVDGITLTQKQEARQGLKDVPSLLTLMNSLRHWADALCDACRLFAERTVEIHADSEEQDIASLAVGTLADVLCNYLRIPSQQLLLDEWPDNNGVRDFILEVTDAPIELKGSELIVNPVLPRWEPKSHFARAIAGLSSPPSTDRFLSVEESQTKLEELENSFRNALFSGLQAIRSQAVLAAPAADARPRSRKALSEFDQLAGQLYQEALLKNQKHRVSEENFDAIAKRLDAAGLVPRDHLEKRARENLARFNRESPRRALKTWIALAKHRRFKSVVRHRFARAAEKYRNSRP